MKTNGEWLTVEMRDQLSQESESSDCGVLLLTWDIATDSAGSRLPPRLLRPLQAIALRFAEETGDVAGWLVTDSALLFIVRTPSDGEDAAGDDAGLTKLLYALRESAFRVFTGRSASARWRAQDRIRCGLASVARRGVANGRKPPGHTVEAALAAAVLQAWQMALSDSSFAFDLSECHDTTGVSIGDRMAVRYIPIVSLSDGSLFAYEAQPFDRTSGEEWTPERFFALSEREGALYDNDRRFRELAIRGMPAGFGAVKLFLPVPARIVFDSRLYPGSTLHRIEAAGLRPEHVVLMIGEGTDHTGTLLAALRHYRMQGFRIALCGVGTGRKSIERMVELKPDYARIEGDWIPQGSRDTVGESLLQAVTSLSRKEKIVVLAGGVASEEQVRPLMTFGVGYGQGEWIGRSSATALAVDDTVSERIRKEVRRRFRGAAGALMELTESALVFPSVTPVSEIAQQFEAHREANGFVIVEGGKPVGLLMREKLHRMLAWQFGLPLYWSRPVARIMDTQPLVVEESTPVDQLSQTAMAREPDKLYDAVIVTRGGEVTGIVSISALLEWVTNVRMTDAQWANPLTGLPGNEPIRRELSRRIDAGSPFAVLYADLDHFKWYNDQYGFHRGDDVIRFTAETLQAVVREYCPEDSFVGHIGGDDFIVVIDYGNPLRIAEEVLSLFEMGISSFQDSSHGTVRDRAGNALEGAGLSLSLALLLCQDSSGWTPEKLAQYSALLKKKAKSVIGSKVEWETLEDHASFVNRTGLTVR